MITMQVMEKENIPNYLTLARIAVIPVFAGIFCIPFEFAKWVAFLLFLAAALTDYADGFLARKWGVKSDFGKMMDPIADKLIIVTALILLVRENVAHLVPVIIILLREMLISGLREYLGNKQVELPVSHLAKWKTAVQLIAVVLLLLAPTGILIIDFALYGNLALWLAAYLTFWTGYDYIRETIQHYPINIAK
jgi:cardiolipin synthase